MIGVSVAGSDKNIRDWISKITRGDIFADLDRYGQMGVTALARATPRDSGLTANSWGYRVIRSRRFPGIEWFNRNVDETGTSIAIRIQYGHGLRGGGFISGRDYINAAMQPIFDQISDDVWKKVIRP